MIWTDKLFILRMHFLLYMQMLVCVMYQRWLATSTVEVELRDARHFLNTTVQMRQS